jgi:hypothetical protein
MRERVLVAVVRGIWWVAEKVVEEAQPGAQAVC